MQQLPRKVSGKNPAKFLLLMAALLVSLKGMAQELGDHQYTSAAIQRGLRIYSRECALCHGPTGDLVSGIDLARGQFRNAASDDDLRSAIIEGRAQGQMPAFALQEEELNGVIAYIRAGFDPEGVAVRIGDAEQGQVLFNGKGECASCHRINGQGPRLAPDLSAIGIQRTPAVLQLNLLNPAAAILPINRPLRVVTRDEEIIIGRRLNEDTYTVQLIDSDERLRSLQKSELLSYEISDQPSKSATTLDANEVADLVAYLLTLKGEA
ncbi:MAG: c-type cytochrome [Gammaproteobacteria bacterium]|nr:c-type cytochrome [Gammaproteobacteria bacterium]MCY4357884.1 c-type cytochrome [Gammaproteobacteria bacterium]